MGRYLFFHPWIFAIFFGGILSAILIQAVIVIAAEKERTTVYHLDDLYGWKNRLSAYFELRDNEHPFSDAVARDAEIKCATVSSFRAAEITKGLVAPAFIFALLCGALILLPYLPVPASIAARKNEQKAIHQAARQLEKTVLDLQKKNPQNPELKKLLSQFQLAARQLQSNDIARADALKKWNQLRTQWNALNEKSLRTNRDALARSLQEAQKQDSNLGSNPEVSKEEISKLASQLESAMEGENVNGGKQSEDNGLSQRMTRAQMEKLKKDLEEFQSKKPDMEKSMAELKQALEDAQKGTGTGTGDHKVTKNSVLSEREMERGKAGVEDGPGTTNFDAGPSTFSTEKKGKSEYVEDRTKAEYEQLYTGQREKVGSDPLLLNNHWSDTGEKRFVEVRTFGVNSDPKVQPGPSVVTGQNSGEGVVRKERIPAAYQDIVKKYFATIQENH